MGEIIINITEFAGYDRASFGQYIELHKDDSFIIRLPKETSIKEDETIAIVQEYMDQLFLGQQFAEVFDEFNYLLPALNQKSFFGYTGQVKDIEKFTSLVFDLIEIWQDEDRRIQLHVDSTAFFCMEHEAPLHCYELYVLADQFLMVLDAEEIDEEEE